MLAEQFTEAAAGARTMQALDNVARLLWRAHAEGHLGDASAQAVAEAVEARKRAIKGLTAVAAIKPPIPRRRAVSPDKRKSLERRRRIAASGAVPGFIACEFTLGETAALSIIAREVQRRGRCEFHIDRIAALAGVCRTLVQDALRHASRLGLIQVTERRRRGQRSDTNVVRIIAAAWKTWLRIGGRVQKSEHHEIQAFKILVESDHKAGNLEAFAVCSWHNPTHADRPTDFRKSNRSHYREA